MFFRRIIHIKQQMYQSSKLLQFSNLQYLRLNRSVRKRTLFVRKRTLYNRSDGTYNSANSHRLHIFPTA